MSQYIKWGDIKHIFKSKLRVVYLILPRQTGKTKLLLDSFVENVDNQLLVTMNTNMTVHLHNEFEKFYGPAFGKYHINTLTNFIRKMDALVGIKRILVDEFDFMDTRKLFEFLKTMVKCGVSEIIATTTLSQRMNKTQFEHKFCVFNSAEYSILTVDDLDLCVPLERLNAVLETNGPEVMINEMITGGICHEDSFH